MEPGTNANGAAPTAEAAPAALSWGMLEAATNALPVLGHAVMWSLDGVQCELEPLQTLMAAHGLGQFKVLGPSPRVALHRALVSLLQSRLSNGESVALRLFLDDEEDASDRELRRPLIRPMPDPVPDWMAFGLVQEAVQLSAVALSYRTAWRVKVHSPSHRLIATTAPSGAFDQEAEDPALTAMIQPHWDAAQRHVTSRDISLLLKRTVDWASAISLRRDGGVYFVPRTYTEHLDAVRALVKALPTIRVAGGDPTFLTLGVPDLDEAKVHLRKAAHHGLMAQIAEATRDLDAWLGRGQTPKKQTVDRKVYEYAQLGLRVELYEEMLDLELREAHTALATLRARVRRADQLSRCRRMIA